MNESELIERFRNGDESAFNELVLRYKEKIYWAARRIVRSHDDADDIVQEVLWKVYRGLRNFRSDAGFFTWLYRITVNTSLNALRAKRVREFLRLDELGEGEGPAEDRPDRTTEDDEQRALIEDAIRRLPDKQRAVFVLRYYEQLSYEEIAAILKTSVGGLKANYFHAVRKIEEYVKRAHGA